MRGQTNLVGRGSRQAFFRSLLARAIVIYSALMEMLKKLIDIALHLDRYLKDLVPESGVWIYAILFLIIFCETGLVVTPFLPGDSLLFAIGALAGAGSLNLVGVQGVLILAALCGDNTNYWIGHFIGPKLFKGESRLLN